MSQNLFDRIIQFRDDPLGFVHYSFPWESIGPIYGLEDWQTDVLRAIREPGRYAISSGHGVGKGALVSMIILWMLSTHYCPSIVVTSNTAGQLSTKTWRELSIWHRRCITYEWFKHTATKLFLRENPAAHFAAAIPWSADTPESIAGTHADYMLWIADEASALPDIIWEVAEGAMTTGRCWQIVLGNPTRRGTRFEKCFTDPRWKTWKVDSRDCKRTNKFEINEQVKTYGEDSDFIRVRVKGEFPVRGTDQLIPVPDVEAAWGRQVDAQEVEPYPKILAIDPARYGLNKTAIIKRQGKAATDLQYLAHKDTIYVANVIATIINNWNPDIVNIDSGGGGGIIDVLRNQHYRVNEVSFGGASLDPHYRNARTYMWVKMRDWLQRGGCIPLDVKLKQALPIVGYTYDPKGRMTLQQKKTLQGQRNSSEQAIDLDGADALALTFATPVPMTPLVTGKRRKVIDWDPLK